MSELCQRYTIPQKLTEPYSPWQNYSEHAGGIIKRKVYHLMQRTNTFLRLWNYCWEYVIQLQIMTAYDHIYGESSTPFQQIYEYTPDISELLQLQWFDWVHYHEPADPNKELLGRWLGPAYSVGQGMAYHVLTEKGSVKMHSTVKAINKETKESPTFTSDCQKFMEEVDSLIGNNSPSTQKNTTVKHEDPYINLFYSEDDDETDNTLHEEEKLLKPLDDLVVEHPSAKSGDNFIGCKVQLPIEGELIEGEVKSHKRDSNGMLVGRRDKNPLLNTRVYQVEFPDGSYREYPVNLIAESLYSSVDQDGQTVSLMQSTIDYQFYDDAIPKEQSWTICPQKVRNGKSPLLVAISVSNGKMALNY